VAARPLPIGILLAAAGLAATAAALLLLHAPARAGRIAAAREEREAAALLASAEALAETVRDGDPGLAGLRGEAERLERRSEALARVGDLAPRIRACAAGAGLEVREESPFEPARAAEGGLPGGPAAPKAGRFRKRLSLAGDFPAVRRFARALEGMPDLLRVVSLDVRRPEGPGPLAVEIEIEVIKGAVETAAAGGGPR